MVEVLKDPINTLYSQMESSTNKYNTIFAIIQDEVEALSISGGSNKDKMQTVLTTEFMLYKLRINIANEMNQVKMILNTSSKYPASSIGVFKQRDIYLASFNQRLNEIRLDLENIQKSVYTLQSSNLYK